MLETALPGSRRITLGADKGYDTAEFVDLSGIPCLSQWFLISQ
jgi:hypothetical protein